MRLIIHRGTGEISGSCVELRSTDSRILVNFGTLEKIDGILVPHFDLDHCELLQSVPPETPVYLSLGASLLINVSNIFAPAKAARFNAIVIKNKKEFKAGDFTITPYPVDRSPFDALAFLVQADGKRLFYSGDFLVQPPRDIDCLLMEGSAPGTGDALYKTEEQVQKRIEEILKEKKNIAFLFAASQNIDRVVSAYKACLKTGSILVIDIYTALILDKLRKASKNIPSFNWKNIRIKFFSVHADALTKAGYRALLFYYNKNKIDNFELNRKKDKILMLARDNSLFPAILKEVDDVQGAKIIYSMPQEYLTDRFRQYADLKGFTIEHVHASGRASGEDLRVFVDALNPKVVIPVSPFDKDKYPVLFKNVKMLDDGEEYTI